MELNHRTNISPEQYWKALKKDDENAFSELYKQFANPLYNYGLKFTTDLELIKECIQSLFVTLWTRRNKLGETGSVRNYLFKALRIAIFKRRQLAQLQEEFDATENYHFLATLSFEHTLIMDEQELALRERLQRGLDLLSARQREAIFLRFYEGMSYAEVAQVMDISVKGTYKLMSRAIETLRSGLDHSDFSVLLLLFSYKLFN